jgi:uncharacterized protein YegP (UPF0339 family)
VRFAFIDAWKEEWAVEFLCKVMRVTSRGFRAWRVRPMSKRQRGDMVFLAHIREQHRLSLQSYGRPRMTEELQEEGLNVGHRRVGRLMRENGIKIIRTQKYKATTIARQAIAKQSAERGIATIRSTLHPTYWIKTSQRLASIRNGQVTSATSGPVKAGYIWPSSLTCTPAASSDGPSATA